MSNEYAKAQPTDTQPVNNSGQAPQPGISQALLDSGQSKNIFSLFALLTATVQDESLKALMTSWYFAGYYTGLYEGQRKAQADQEHPTH